jgi:hypothetical protein
VKDEFVEETHDSLGMSRRTLPATVKSTLSIGHMFGAFKPAVDSVPTESDSLPNPMCKDIPAMREIDLSSHTILTLSFGEFYTSAQGLEEGQYLTMAFRDVAS